MGPDYFDAGYASVEYFVVIDFVFKFIFILIVSFGFGFGFIFIFGSGPDSGVSFECDFRHAIDAALPPERTRGSPAGACAKARHRLADRRASCPAFPPDERTTTRGIKCTQAPESVGAEANPQSDCISIRTARATPRA
jgi:hypothetical protein